MFASLVLLALVAQSPVFQLESQVKTATGSYERFVDRADERRFKVRWTRLNGSSDWIVKAEARSTDVVFRRPVLGIMAAQFEEVVERNVSTGRERILGHAKRIFNSTSACSATAFLGTPTVKGMSWFHNLRNLNCDSTGYPQISNLSVIFDTTDQPFEVTCLLPFQGFCLWVSDHTVSDLNKGQLLSITALQRAEDFLASSRIQTRLPTLRVNPWASQTNNSQYDAQTKTIYLGLGSIPDSHDGFIIVHEWAHFLMDEINPGLWGYDAEVFHEAIADFLATDLWNSSCFAPYDAQEVEERQCLRNVKNTLKYPDDMIWSDVHSDSRVFSGALWEGVRGFSKEVRWGVLLETLISLPKNFEAQEFWDMFLSALARHNIIPDSRATPRTLTEVLRKRGFLSQDVEPSDGH